MVTSPTCANCGAELVGPWCHACGQRARSLREPLPELLHEAADVLFDVDNRFFRSIRALVTRPGALSLAWASGRRSAFTGPVRLYLLASVLYFLVASLVETSSLGFITFDSGEELNRRFAEALPRMMFVIVPLSAVVFRLAFRVRRLLYIEHLVFALHVHAGWYLLFAAEALVTTLAVGAASPAISVGLTVIQVLLRLATLAYVFLAARRFYGLSRGATALRVLLAMTGYAFLLAIAVGAYMSALILLGP